MLQGPPEKSSAYCWSRSRIRTPGRVLLGPRGMEYIHLWDVSAFPRQSDSEGRKGLVENEDVERYPAAEGLKKSARAEQGRKGSLVPVNLNPLHLLGCLRSSVRNSGNEVDVVASLIQAQTVGRQDALCATDLTLKIGIRDDQKVQQVPFFCNRVVLSNR